MGRRLSGVFVGVCVAGLFQAGFMVIFFYGVMCIGKGIDWPFRLREYPQVGSTIGDLWVGYIAIDATLSICIIVYCLLRPAQKRLCLISYCLLNCAFLCTACLLCRSLLDLASGSCAHLGWITTGDRKRTFELLRWFDEQGFTMLEASPGENGYGELLIVPKPRYGPEEAKRLIRASSQPVLLDDDSAEAKPP
jgi:hypothetical protein